jgi:hypothetical protein
MSRRAPPRPGITPQYELRAKKRGPGDLALDVWELPSVATPGLKEPRYVGGLAGRNLALVDHRVLKQLRAAGVDVGRLRTGDVSRHEVDEDLALRLALTFRALAPMRNRGFMRAVAEGIDAMAREEAAYWLGMAMHRRYPRRVLKALRCLLAEPRYFR